MEVSIKVVMALQSDAMPEDVRSQFEALRQSIADEIYQVGLALLTGSNVRLHDLRYGRERDGTVLVYPKVTMYAPERTGLIELHYAMRGVRDVIVDRLARFATGWSIVRFYIKAYNETF